MSVNLAASVNGHQIDLWQTPTQITYTILPDGLPLTGKKAQYALKQYQAWVKYSVNRSYSSLYEITEYQKSVDEHIKYVESFLNEKSIRVYVL